jgi:hypothetical protein
LDLGAAALFDLPFAFLPPFLSDDLGAIVQKISREVFRLSV